MKSWFFGGAALVALSLPVAASAAAAEPPIGSRLGSRVEKQKAADEKNAVLVAHELAGCLIVKRGSVARHLLDSRDAEEVQKLNSSLTGEVECLANISGNDLVEGVQVNYPTDVMRGDLAEELLRKDERSILQLPAMPIQRTYSRPWFALSGRHDSVDEMAACVASTNPAAVMALVDSTPFSASEDSAFSNLIPLMGPCLVAGTKLDAKREPLRAALAEALYQRLNHPEEEVTPHVEEEHDPPKH